MRFVGYGFIRHYSDPYCYSETAEPMYSVELAARTMAVAGTGINYTVSFSCEAGRAVPPLQDSVVYATYV